MIQITSTLEISEVRKQQLLHYESWQTPESQTQKLAQMASSPFAYFRASAATFYDDIKHNRLVLPDSWLNLGTPLAPWICADLHIQNLGFSDHEGEVIFGLNDFDESQPGNPAWDWMRFLSSIHLMGASMENPISEDEVQDISKDFLKSLRDEYLRVAQDPQLAQTLISKDSLDKGIVSKKLSSLKKKRDHTSALSKWTDAESHAPRFLHIPEKLEPIDKALSQLIQSAVESHIGAVNDVARRLGAGLGSIGRERYYLLAGSEIYELKEQRQGVLSQTQLQPYNRAAGQRVCEGGKRLTGIDAFCPGTVKLKDSQFTLKRISPYKDDFAPEDLKDSKDLEDLVQAAAIEIARAHMRTVSEASVRAKLAEELAMALEDKESRHAAAKAAISWAEQLEQDHKQLNPWLLGTGE